MQAPEPQAILSPLTEAAIFLVLSVDSGGEHEVRDLLADMAGLRRSVGFRIPDGELSCVVGVGSKVWDRLYGDTRPAGLHPLAGIAGARHEAPATAGDLLFHIRARRLDLCFELAGLLTGRLRGAARVIDEVHGFKSFDERDLLGFVDGTENPEGRTAREAVLIGEEDPDYAGGSYVVVQKYLHDLDSWEALAVEEQERAVGRTKLSDVELADDAKPANSHVALNTIVDEDGEQRQIVRFNMPFGSVGAREFGTYFIGYARHPDVIEQMLENMFVGNPAGTYDRLLDFSRAVTGSLFFVPPAALLEAGDAAPESAQAAVQGAQAAADGASAVAAAEQDGDGSSAHPSLGIGGLRGESRPEG